MKKKTKIVLLSILAFLIAIRLLLPSIVLYYANATLSHIKGYYGHVEDIDLAIYRGAYQVDGITFFKVDSLSGERTLFFACRKTDISVEWKSLFKGRFVGEIYVYEPQVIFTLEKAEPAQLEKDSSTFRDLFDKMMPIDVNRFQINEGKIKYDDFTSEPQVHLVLSDLFVDAANLSTVVDSALLPSPVKLRGRVYGGTVEMNAKLNLLAEHPTYDLNAKVEQVQLPELNDFFQAYAKVDLNKGTFGLYSEVASENGKFEGYVKPILKDIDVAGKEDRDDTIFRRIWESIVGTVGDLFTNRKEKQLATKVRISGNYGETNISLWYSVVQFLRNAFIEALYPAIDYQIDINSVAADGEEAKK